MKFSTDNRTCRVCNHHVEHDGAAWVDAKGVACLDGRHEPRLRILDLFSGLHGWSKAFTERGHEVVTVDIEAKFNCTITSDVLELTVEMLEEYGPFDIILASPPCEAFSVAALSRNWEVVDGKGVNSKNPIVKPRSSKAELGQKLVEHTLHLIEGLDPEVWVMENPRAMMRRLEVLQDHDRHTVTYCKYGKTYMKPTDLWSNAHEDLNLHDACQTRKNKNNPKSGQLMSVGDKTYVTDIDGHPCHESAPRGSRTGVQGIATSEERAVVPYMLSLQVCKAVEEMLHE